MRAILANAETLRAAAIDLDRVVTGATDAGVHRPAIVEALRQTVGDWEASYDLLFRTGELLAAIKAPVSMDFVILSEEPIATPGMLATAAEENGYYGFQCGKTIADNPNEHGTVLYRRWRKGWVAASVDAKEG